MGEHENISFIIRHKIKSGQQARYENWLKRIVPLAATYPGHQGTHIIRPSGGNAEYVIVIRFADIGSAKNWIDSPDRHRLVAEVADLFVAGDATELKSGIDFWFTPASEKRPPSWKQWLLTTLIITPLTMVVPMGFKPVFAVAPPLAVFGLSHLLVTSVIVGLVTFLIMPRAVHALRPWLFKE